MEISNPDFHPDSPLFGSTWVFTKSGNTLTLDIVGPDVDLTLTGPCDEDGNFNLSGGGTYFVFSTGASLDGSIDGDLGEFEGEFSVGDGGGLPDGGGGNNGAPLVGDVFGELL